MDLLKKRGEGNVLACLQWLTWLHCRDGHPVGVFRNRRAKRFIQSFGAELLLNRRFLNFLNIAQ